MIPGAAQGNYLPCQWPCIKHHAMRLFRATIVTPKMAVKMSPRFLLCRQVFFDTRESGLSSSFQTKEIRHLAENIVAAKVNLLAWATDSAQNEELSFYLNCRHLRSHPADVVGGGQTATGARPTFRKASAAASTVSINEVMDFWRPDRRSDDNPPHGSARATATSGSLIDWTTANAAGREKTP